MNSVTTRYLAFVLLAFSATAAKSQELDGLWKLSIRDLKHNEVSTLTIRFTDKPGQSCMGGDWRQIAVQSAKTSDPRFFPVGEALTYELKGSNLVIGRNEICDGYLHLGGKFDGKTAKGRYYAFGLGGGTDLGEFSLHRDR